MKFVLIALFWFCPFLQAYASVNFDNLNQNKILDKKIQEVSDDYSPVKIVQSRFVPKKYLSEFSLSASGVIKGSLYAHTGSLQAGYRLYFNETWSLGLQYSKFLSLINREGLFVIEDQGVVPISLKFAPKEAYSLHLDWSSFYGKAVAFNRVFQFDIYKSLILGHLKFTTNNHTVQGGVAAGLVFWWTTFLNSRLEVSQIYYLYPRLEKDVREYDFLNSVSLSLGWLL